MQAVRRRYDVSPSTVFPIITNSSICLVQNGLRKPAGVPEKVSSCQDWILNALGHHNRTWPIEFVVCSPDIRGQRDK